MTAERLDVSQRATDRRDLACCVRDEGPPSAVAGAAIEAEIGIPSREQALRAGGRRASYKIVISPISLLGKGAANCAAIPPSKIRLTTAGVLPITMLRPTFGCTGVSNETPEADRSRI